MGDGRLRAAPRMKPAARVGCRSAARTGAPSPRSGGRGRRADRTRDAGRGRRVVLHDDRAAREHHRAHRDEPDVPCELVRPWDARGAAGSRPRTAHPDPEERSGGDHRPSTPAPDRRALLGRSIACSRTSALPTETTNGRTAIPSRHTRSSLATRRRAAVSQSGHAAAESPPSPTTRTSSERVPRTSEDVATAPALARAGAAAAPYSSGAGDAISASSRAAACPDERTR